MATKSFLKNINIKNKKDSYSFIVALEKANSKKGKSVTISKSCSDATPDEIAAMFKKNDRV